MDHLDLHTPDLTAAAVDRIAELFPHVITERAIPTYALGEAERERIARAIDFDLLRQELSDYVVEGPQERFHLDWPGKRAALLAANAPISKTLRPIREESVDFDTTRNLFIEGDNLDALKLLQESYLGKIKLIYIDPPYNTGNDFVYNDDFAETSEEYLRRSGQTDESGARLVANPESNGRFHSDWLSMMYSRLKLSRNLLTDNGLIFISLDDGEIADLRRVCDEVFGEDQFVANVIWKKRNTPPNDRIMGAQHDYILVYARSGLSGLRYRPRTPEQTARYQNPDNHPKGPWVAGDLTANVKGGRYVTSLNYPITNPRNGLVHWPPRGGNWRFNSTKVEQLIDEDAIYFGQDDKGAPKVKRFLADVKEGTTWTTLWDFPPYNSSGSQEMQDLFGTATIFESPKPVGLLSYVLEAASDPESIVLDFFAGSSSMAHATLKANVDDGGNRRFIMVQLDEPTEANSEAKKAGYATISDLSKERIRRGGKKIKDAAGLTGEDLDTGFRVLKIDSTNMADVHKTPDETAQDALTGVVDSVKPGRSEEDLLFQVMLDWGLELTMPIAEQSIAGKSVLDVDDGAMLACFDREITPDVVRYMAEQKPLRAVFLDAGFASDADRINAEQVFREVSPDADVKAI